MRVAIRMKAVLSVASISSIAASTFSEAMVDSTSLSTATTIARACSMFWRSISACCSADHREINQPAKAATGKVVTSTRTASNVRKRRRRMCRSVSAIGGGSCGDPRAHSPLFFAFCRASPRSSGPGGSLTSA
jgi:hypothetical protein